MLCVQTQYLCRPTTGSRLYARLFEFFSLECLASLRCPPVLASSKDGDAKVHCREVVEESDRGSPLGDLNEHPFFFFFFCNGPNVVAFLLPHFSVVARIWLIGHISSCN